MIMTVYPKEKMIEVNKALSRVNFRIQKFRFRFFMMFAITQTLEGFTSLLPNGLHLIFYDSADNVDINELKKLWLPIQKRHNLSNCYFVSDKKGSYRIWCFNQISFDELLIILLEAYKLIDWSFFKWTVDRGKATIRTTDKIDRPKQEIIDVLESYYIPMPEILEKVRYDTGINKNGISILLGEKGKIKWRDNHA